MSSDNYYYIRKHGDGYAVTEHFMGDEEADDYVPTGGAMFDTLLEAMAYAQYEYSEYGVILSDECYTLAMGANDV